MALRLRSQETPLDDCRPRHFFLPHAGKPFRATAGALQMYTREQIAACLLAVQLAAVGADGLEYAQVFESDEHPENLWIIEDNGEIAITALLPSEY